MRWINNETKLNTSITLASLLPKNTDVFYSYKGSLTTPPCNEVVTWIIFSMPVPISFSQVSTPSIPKFQLISFSEEISSLFVFIFMCVVRLQLNKFRLLSNGNNLIADNYRKLQNIGLRKVYIRKLSPHLFVKYNETTFNVADLDWFWTK